jgi:ribosomal protein S18 acetylase RimI-like enzyme
MDWRWGSNTRFERNAPGWFSTQCRILHDDGVIAAVVLAETGRNDVSIITPAEAPGLVREVLDWLPRSTLALAGEAIRLEVSDDATWLLPVLVAAGLTKEPNTGVEWEYDLTSVSTEIAMPDGFTVESLAADDAVGHSQISDCIRAAFGTEHDVAPTLESIESNPMYRPELSVYARTADGRVAAYCRGTADPANGICGIDPVCTHPDFGRLGLATAVVRACFATQRALGGTYCYIGSAPEPEPSTFLYRSLGPSRAYVASTWTLPATLSAP